MLKTFYTLFRGSVYNAESEFKDRNAHLLLQQQLRDASHEVGAARKAVAVAIAQNKQEKSQHEKLLDRLKDLETRTVDALHQDKQELAREGAEMIALMETERDVSEQAQAQFSKEIGHLKSNVQTAESKLREIQRGQRLATATRKTQELRTQSASSGLSSLKEAEETLKRLRYRQTQIELTDQALAEMDSKENPQEVAKKLAAAGCGKPQITGADDVLARLSAAHKTKTSKKAK